MSEATETYGFRVRVCANCLRGGGTCWNEGCMFWGGQVPSDDVAARLLLAFTNDDDATEDR